MSKKNINKKICIEIPIFQKKHIILNMRHIKLHRRACGNSIIQPVDTGVRPDGLVRQWWKKQESHCFCVGMPLLILRP